METPKSKQLLNFPLIFVIFSFQLLFLRFCFDFFIFYFFIFSGFIDEQFFFPVKLYD